MIYLSIDVEASGPFPGLFSLVSIGAAPVALVDSRWEVLHGDSFYVELKPTDGASELEAATKIHGLTREYLVEHGLEPLAAMRQFRQYLRKLNRQYRKVVPAAWPSSFDSPYVGWYLQRFLGTNSLGWSAFDIPSYAQGLFRCAREDLRQRLRAAGLPKPPNPKPHHALHDAIEQGQTLAQLLNYARQGAQD